jgi:hypothetical protein
MEQSAWHDLSEHVSAEHQTAISQDARGRDAVRRTVGGVQLGKAAGELRREHQGQPLGVGVTDRQRDVGERHTLEFLDNAAWKVFIAE